MSESLRNRTTAISAATVGGASGPDETGSTNTPPEAPVAGGWQSLLCVVLGICIGVIFARTAPARWLGLDNGWAFVVELTAAGLGGGIGAWVGRGLFKLFGRRSEWPTHDTAQRKKCQESH